MFFDDDRFILTPSSSFSSKRGEVVSGTYSLKGSWSGDGSYHPYLYTDCTALQLKPGGTYRLTFKYRVLKTPDRGFETIFYSPTAAARDQWLPSCEIAPSAPRSGTAELTVTLYDFNDYEIRWNIIGTGAISIDSIKLEELINGKARLVMSVDLEPITADIKVTHKTIETKVKNRRTVPVFYPWGQAFSAWRSDTPERPYGLLWTGEGLPRDLESTIPELGPRERYRMVGDTDTLYLISLEWHYWSPTWQTLSKDSKFYLDEVFQYHVGSEYAHTLVINFEHPEWAELMAKKAENYRKTGYDGLMLDWWHDGAGNGRSEERVQEARLRIIKAMRERAGDDFILLGNVNWGMDDPTAPYLSGVFLELWKPQIDWGYAVTIADEASAGGVGSIERMEQVLMYWDEHLAWPRIIAFEPWKITMGNYITDRESEENKKLAKLFAAMGCVIPENGYVLYADNNDDWNGGDHQHAYYDFYRIDLGEPVSLMNPVEGMEGVAWREYEKGYIAYNRTESKVDVMIAGNRRLVLEPLEGIFVKEPE